MEQDPKRYCGIVFIGGGSSHAWAPEAEQAAQAAARQAKDDWKSFYKFQKAHPFTVLVFDMKDREGWYATYAGVFDRDTKEKLTPAQTVKVIV